MVPDRRPPIVVERSPLGSPPIWRVFLRFLLPTLFIAISATQGVDALVRGYLGIDTRIYYRAAQAFVGGADPWEAVVVNDNTGLAYHFSALPTMVVLGVPFTLVPEDAAVAVVLALCAGSALFVVRRLGLPWYWLAFPPLVAGVLSANPSLPVLALLLTRWAPVAVLLKVYAVVPLLGEARWRAVVVSIVATIATVIAFPSLWLTYARDFGGRAARLVLEAHGGYGSLRDPLLLAGAVIALAFIARRDRRAAGWLFVPALWPASQFHWSTLAMPVMTPLLAVMLALPVRGMPAVAVIAYALVTVLPGSRWTDRARDRVARSRLAVAATRLRVRSLSQAPGIDGKTAGMPGGGLGARVRRGDGPRDGATPPSPTPR